LRWVAVCVLLSLASSFGQSPRERQNLDNGWRLRLAAAEAVLTVEP